MIASSVDIRIFRLKRPQISGIAPAEAKIEIERFLEELQDRSKAVRVYVDGFLIEHLIPEHEELLRSLCQHEQVHALRGYYFEPNAELCSPEDLRSQLKLSEQFWARLGNKTCKGTVLLGPVSQAQLQIALESESEAVFAESSTFPQNKESFYLSQDDHKTPLLLFTLSEASSEIRCESPSSELVVNTEQLFASLPVTSLSEAALLAELRTELSKKLIGLPEYVRNNPLEYVNKERLQSALKWFRRSQHLPPATEHASSLLLKKQCVNCLLHAQVEIDAIYHPETDPSDGWLQVEQELYNYGELESFVLQTPFARHHFTSREGGGLQALDYKPRKLALLDANKGEPRTSFTAYLAQNSEEAEATPIAEKGILSVPRKNPGLQVIRATQPLRHSQLGRDALVVKDFMIKSGLGAHRPNSTCGFSLEYWLEGYAGKDELDANLELVVECFYAPPSLSGELLQLRSLLPAGGISDDACSLEVLRHITLPEQLSGVRLIDSLDQFVIDFRSAKPLSHVESMPLYQDSDFLGVRLRFAIPVLDILDSFESNSLFVSIN